VLLTRRRESDDWVLPGGSLESEEAPWEQSGERSPKRQGFRSRSAVSSASTPNAASATLSSCSRPQLSAVQNHPLVRGELALSGCEGWVLDIGRPERRVHRTLEFADVAFDVDQVRVRVAAFDPGEAKRRGTLGSSLRVGQG
jgi:hypothetical protein